MCIRDRASTLSAGTALYYDFANTRWTLTETGIAMAEILSSGYKLPDVGSLITADLNIDSTGELNTYLNKTARAINSPVITLTRIGEGHPLNDEVAEGDAFAFVVDTLGVIDITVPAGQGFKTDTNADVPGGTYRITGATNDEGVRVYREGDNWRLDVLNSGLLLNSLLFDADAYNARLLSSRVDALESLPVTTSPSTDSTLSITSANRAYHVRSSDDTKVVSFLSASSYGLTANTFTKVTINNVDDNWLQVETHDSGTDFGQVGHHLFFLEPRETRDFLIIHDGANQTIVPVGEIVYEFEVSGPSSFSGSSNIVPWAVQGGVPAGVVEVPSGDTDQIEYKIPGDVDVTFEVKWEWFGATTTVTVDGQTLWDNDIEDPGPSIIIDKNGSQVHSSQATTLLKIQGTGEHFNDPLLDNSVVAGDYFTYQASNLVTKHLSLIHI